MTQSPGADAAKTAEAGALLIERTFAAVAAKDLDAIVRVFTDDALVIDSHFPAAQVGKE